MSESDSTLKVGVVKETFPAERRVALIPASIGALKKAGVEVLVQSGAGAEAGFDDSEYEAQGAKILDDRAGVFSQADVLFQVRMAGANPSGMETDCDLLHSGQTVIGLCDPLGHPQQMARLAEKGVTTFALELLPRVTRAQSMDVLSSMASIAGYKSVLLAAATLPRMFPMMMTAAGTITPAKVFVVGVGVAGLQAIATAKRLGAVVYAYDIRTATREEAVSLGAKFVELELETEGSQQSGGYAKEMGEDFYRRQREMMQRVVAESNVVITTAAVPGKKAPVLVTGEMVAGMAPGSVIVDLAAEQGGNCELTQPGETAIEHGVSIIGAMNVPSTIPFHASQMYSRNITTFLLHLLADGSIQLNHDDEIVSETVVTHDGEVVHSGVREALGLPTESAGSTDSADASEGTSESKASSGETATAGEEPGGLEKEGD